MSEETKFTMEYGAGQPSPRQQRRSALLWRLHLARQARKRRIAALKRQAKSRLNTENKPLGAK